MVPGRHELPPRVGVSYIGYCDPSGGRHDAMTLAIAHQEDGVTVLDRLDVALPPFSPDTVARNFVAVLKPYGLSAVHGDRYVAAWSEERFRVHGITYLASERTTSEHFVAFLPLLTSNTVELLDDGQLRHELCGLERRRPTTAWYWPRTSRPSGGGGCWTSASSSCSGAATTSANRAIPLYSKPWRGDHERTCRGAHATPDRGDHHEYVNQPDRART
jgi:hypothetical protein